VLVGGVTATVKPFGAVARDSGGSFDYNLAVDRQNDLAFFSVDESMNSFHHPIAPPSGSSIKASPLGSGGTGCGVRALAVGGVFW
jgi:hypothetical protein